MNQILVFNLNNLKYFNIDKIHYRVYADSTKICVGSNFTLGQLKALTGTCCLYPALTTDEQTN